jgi:methionyl-tRNA formyltransferase
VKERALAAGVPVLQPQRLRDPEWAPRLRELRADVAVVVAFGQILPATVLAAPVRGSINVHASILPRYRGAAPIAWAIIRGETETGITTFQMDEGMDTGAMLLTRTVAIGPEETAGELATRLAPVGADVMIDTLDRLDTLTPLAQQHEAATLAPRLKRSDGSIDWMRPAHVIVNQIRGCNPWPGATTRTPRGTLMIHRAAAARWDGPEPPGTLVRIDAVTASPPGGVSPSVGTVEAIATGDGALVPREVQPESRRAIAWTEFLRGSRLEPGIRFESP